MNFVLLSFESELLMKSIFYFSDIMQVLRQGLTTAFVGGILLKITQEKNEFSLAATFE